MKKSLLVVLVVASMTLAACSGWETTVTTPTSSSTTPAPAQTGTTGSEQSVGVKEFVIEGSNMKFVPNEMRVKKGDTVRVTFKNTGGVHDFSLDEFKVKTKQLEAGSSEVVEFVADKTGTFEYYCSVGFHRQLGMKGKLVVE